MAQQTSFGGSDISEKEQVKDIQKQLEKFEISHGRITDSIVKYGSERRHNNNNDITNNKNTSNNNDESNDKSNNDKPNNDNTEWNKLYELYNLEPFSGSQIIAHNEKMLSTKSIIVSILFLLVSHSIIKQLSIKLYHKIGFLSPIVVQSILFGFLFYITEKYLLSK